MTCAGGAPCRPWSWCSPAPTVADPAAASAIVAACYTAGVVVLTCGTWSNVVRLLPPLTIDDALLSDGLDVLEQAVGSISRGCTGCG